MKRIPLIRVASITPIRDFLAGSGAKLNDVFRSARLPSGVFDDPELLLPYPIVAQFLDAAGCLDELLGAKAGHATPVETLGVFGRRVAAGPTLGDALATVARIAPEYFSGERFWLTPVGVDDVRLSHRYPARFHDRHQQAEQLSLCVALRFLKSVAAPAWRPTVHVKRGTPRAIVEMPLLRGAVVRFDEPAWSITFPRSLLLRHVPTAPTVALRPIDVAESERPTVPRDSVNAITQVIRTALVGGDAQIGRVASWMDVSTRTLQRRLAEANVSYAKLLARARYTTATLLLDDRQVTLQEIARLLGYSDPAHFTRAFRRWTGCTPRAFRGLRLAEAAALRAATSMRSGVSRPLGAARA